MRSLDGGMDAWNGVVATGGYERGMELVADLRSPAEVLPLAMALEEGSRVFYEKAGELVEEARWREVFAALVKAEERHKKALLEACRGTAAAGPCDAPGAAGGAAGLMEGAAGIDGALEWAGTPGRTPLEILELSMQVEANSLDLYLKIAGRPEFSPVRGVLESLIDDEKRHLARLGALLEKHASRR